MKTPRPRSTEPGAALPDTMVRVVLPPPLCVAGPRSTSWRRPPRAAGHVPRLRYAAAASLTSGSSPAEWICRSMRRMRRCRRRYHRATSRFRWWGRWLGGEGDPDGVVQPSPGTPSLPNSSTGSSSACSPPPSACSSRRLIGRELERLVRVVCGRGRNPTLRLNTCAAGVAVAALDASRAAGPPRAPAAGARRSGARPSGPGGPNGHLAVSGGDRRRDCREAEGPRWSPTFEVVPLFRTTG